MSIKDPDIPWVVIIFIATTLIGVLMFYLKHHKDNITSDAATREKSIDAHIKTIINEINRIKNQKAVSGSIPVGNIVAIETILPQIESLGFDISEHWDEYKKNEHKRLYFESSGRKENAINALNKIIHVLQSNQN